MVPVPITSLKTDEVLLPRLLELKRISKENPELTWLEIHINLDQAAPVLPGDFPSHTALKTLRLRTRTEFEEFTTEDKFKLGRYLERLFPNATVLCSARSGSPEWDFWNFVNQLLSFSRASRAHAIRNFEDSMML